MIVLRQIVLRGNPDFAAIQTVGGIGQEELDRRPSVRQGPKSSSSPAPYRSGQVPLVSAASVPAPRNNGLNTDFLRLKNAARRIHRFDIPVRLAPFRDRMHHQPHGRRHREFRKRRRHGSALDVCEDVSFNRQSVRLAHGPQRSGDLAVGTSSVSRLNGCDRPPKFSRRS